MRTEFEIACGHPLAAYLARLGGPVGDAVDYGSRRCFVRLAGRYPGIAGLCAAVQGYQDGRADRDGGGCLVAEDLLARLAEGTGL